MQARPAVRAAYQGHEGNLAMAGQSGARQYRTCPGCGMRLPMSEEAFGDERYNASPECWQLHGELTAYTVEQGYRGGDFIHQLLVDAYGAQHAKATGSAIGLAFALIGLYLTFERGYSGAQVQRMHMLVAQRSKSWPRFTPPVHMGALTVWDVMQAPPGEQRNDTLRQWGRSVWDAWGQEHERVRSLFASVMGD